MAKTTDVYMQEITESVQKSVDAISAKLRLLPIFRRGHAWNERFATQCYQTEKWGICKYLKNLVDLVGIEPTTSSMPWKRAPSCATGPLGDKERQVPLWGDNRLSRSRTRSSNPAARESHAAR